MSAAGLNWAGSYRYGARALHRPENLEQAQEIVAGTRHIRALGTRHSFNALPDSPGDLISLAGLDPAVRIDPAIPAVSVPAAMTYGELALVLDEAGFALHAMASLPHISVAGAIATGTHGSGDRAAGLAAAVVGLEFLDADGDLRELCEGDTEFAAAVVGLGALGIVTGVTMRIEPAYRMRQYVLTGVPWSVVLDDFDAVMALGESVSLFTSWDARVAGAVWVKRRTDRAGGSGPPEIPGAEVATRDQHPVPGADPAVCTPQRGVPGPWHQRLPHFRMGFTPSVGAEIQVEYVLSREFAVPAIRAMIALGGVLAPVLGISEVRTIAADELWLSPVYGRDSISVHFTMHRSPAAVEAVLPVIEEALAPFGARPHWGKWFHTTPDALAGRYPMIQPFRDLAARWDPAGCFGNDFLDRWVFGEE